MNPHSVAVRVIFNDDFDDMLVSAVSIVVDIPMNASAIRGLIQNRLSDLLSYNSDKGLENLFNNKGE